MNTMKSGLLAMAVGLLALTGCMDMMGESNVVKMKADLTAAQEVPANASAGKGTAMVEYNKATRALKWTVNYAGLSGPASMAHFHGPAAPGANAGVAVPIGSTPATITGTATLTDAQAADLLAGRWYLNIHTAANPGGEIRGQVLPAM